VWRKQLAREVMKNIASRLQSAPAAGIERVTTAHGHPRGLRTPLELTAPGRRPSLTVIDWVGSQDPWPWPQPGAEQDPVMAGYRWSGADG
jgi:hypothetical protein